MTMMPAWFERMNQRERILSLIVAGALFFIVNLFVWHVGATQQTLRAIGTDVFAAHLIFISSVNGTLVECSSFITTTIE